MNPDYEIEQYWLGLKQSMINFYDKKSINRPIDIWSNNLNEYQKNKQYELIEENIRNYISLFAIDLIKSKDRYNCHILKTNINRWNNISKKYNFDDPNTVQNTIFVLFSIYYNLMDKEIINENTEYIFLEIELTILYKDYSSLIKYSINTNKPSILKKLNTIIDVKKEIKKIYKYDNKYDNYSFEKIIRILSDN